MDQVPMLGSFSIGITGAKLFQPDFLPCELYLGASVEPMFTAVTVYRATPYEVLAGQLGVVGVASIGSRWWLNENVFLDFGGSGGAELIAANAWYYATYPVDIHWDFTPVWYFVGSADLSIGMKF
jgi:hypothetical protein